MPGVPEIMLREIKGNWKCYAGVCFVVLLIRLAILIRFLKIAIQTWSYTLDGSGQLLRALLTTVQWNLTLRSPH